MERQRPVAMNTVHWLKAKQSPEQRRRAEQVMRATKQLSPRQRLLLIGRMLVTMQPLPPQTWDDALESELKEIKGEDVSGRG